MERKQLARRLAHLAVFQSLRNDGLIAALSALLDAGEDTAEARYLDLAAALYPRGTDLAQAVLTAALEDENVCVQAAAQGRLPAAEAMAWLERELALLRAAALSGGEFRRLLGLPEDLPDWTSAPSDFTAAYREMLGQVPERGFGLFARYAAFSLTEEGQLRPIRHPDPQRLDELYGCEREKAQITKNTEALLSGLRANNVLLYGDAGTGKSSMVKAVLNEYAHRGLRLIQVEKDQLRHIPALLDRLGGLSLKFILFIDDLSFTANDRGFTALKTVLEGSVAARSRNTVVYATSNRRHLVKENFRDRQGDEIHLGDTLEEVGSLSARFGIVITFGKPGRDLYQALVRQLAEQSGLGDVSEDFLQEAEAFALRSGGRSPRVARQYVEYRLAMQL